MTGKMTIVDPSTLDAAKFSRELARITINMMGIRLKLCPEDKLAIQEQLQPVIEAMANSIIHPALIQELVEKHGIITTQRYEDARTNATLLMGTHFAKAILPDLEKPGLLDNPASFKAELSEIAEGLSAISTEEVMEMIAPLTQQALDPSRIPGKILTQKPPFNPTSVIATKHATILDKMLKAYVLLNGNYIYLICDHRKTQPADFDGDNSYCFSDSFIDTLSAAVKDITGLSIKTRSNGQYINSEDSYILLDMHSLPKDVTADNVCAQINSAISHHQSIGRGR